jgi:Zn-dependent peptidase ImmA (M78 family)/transcriptional regulator with XRE-family HTH domain
MAKAVPVSGVQPALLRWARESAHLSIAEVAERLGRTADEVADWESDASAGAPSYSQLEKLAYELYKRPLAIFFLPAPPSEPTPEAEFRALPDADLRRLNRETVFLIRRARAYQASLEELFNGRSPVVDPLWKRVTLNITRPVANQAAAVRAALNVPAVGSNEWGPDGDSALKVWRKAIEQAGVFVFKDTFKQGEISGFCLADPELPVVMINNSTAKTRQVFSLLHELAHVLTQRRAISTFNDAPLTRLAPSEQRIERFCNQIAAEILVPSQDFVVQITDTNVDNLSESDFSALAARYRVSREVILRRFRDADMVTQAFYDERKAEWDRQQEKDEGSGGNFYLTKGAYLSERLMREVFSRYGRRQITIDEAADFIGVKANQVEGLENQFLRGRAA